MEDYAKIAKGHAVWYEFWYDGVQYNITGNATAPMNVTVEVPGWSADGNQTIVAIAHPSDAVVSLSTPNATLEVKEQRKVLKSLFEGATTHHATKH